MKNIAQAWLKHERDPQYKEEIRKAMQDPTLLQEYFGSRLEFGTAGLRGEMGPGPNRMNETVVLQTSTAIAKYIRSFHSSPSVVIGYDARTRSDHFAKIASAAFRTEGVTVFFFPYIVPTPLLAHAVVELNATAGVMITASHNPPKDNGYKVYWSNGAQIIPPHDKGISQIIDTLPFPPPEPNATTKQHIVPEAISTGYMDAVQSLRVHQETGIKIVYTPLHGVGGSWVERTLRRAGHTDLHLVKEQFEPDGNFPFAPFPNPEEDGSMSLAFELAQREQADVIIANDPDADRLAVAIRVDHTFQKLTGDQVGLLLANDLLRFRQWQNPMVATTIVSSSQLKDIATEYDADYKETLTGFKWIANQAIVHDRGDGEFVIGFEEALGYSVGSVARDKDGVSAALLICDLVAYAKSQNKTLIDFLFEIYRKHGFAISAQKSIKKPGSAGKKEISAMMDSFRNTPPKSFSGSEVIEQRDILHGTVKNMRTGDIQTVELPKSNVLVFFLDNDERVIVRPSGTEPKIKFYFEVKRAISTLSEWTKVEEDCKIRIQTLQTGLLSQL
ncbi:MAG: phospho-sugar mutase [Myxococcota bacterium]|nr:phospho-sugar mutase [Myxococcota bacterium]